MKPTINSDGLLRATRHCHYCGDSQTSPTVFSGLFRMPEEVIAEQDSAFFEGDYFEITVCQDCFKEFNNDYNEIVRSAFEAWRY